MKKYFSGLEFIFLGLAIACLVLSGFVASVKLMFPVAYNDEIARYSKMYNLEESLVRSIINVESGYNSLAKSGVGAVGLMQIMPSTGEWVASEIGIEDYELNLLYNPDINIRIGCYYLNYLFLKYQNQHKVLFAYNAGEGVMNSIYAPDMTIVIETIEIVETREYIKKVEKAKKMYDILFN